MMIFTAAWITRAKIYERCKCPANIPKAELEAGGGLWGKGSWVKTSTSVSLCGIIKM